jgi:hypothetical protein
MENYFLVGVTQEQTQILDLVMFARVLFQWSKIV